MEVLLDIRPSYRPVSELLDILFRLGYTVLLAGRTVGAYLSVHPQIRWSGCTYVMITNASKNPNNSLCVDAVYDYHPLKFELNGHSFG